MAVLDRARERQIPEKLAYGGLDGIEICPDWTATGCIASILVRKATGGVKGISRSLAAIRGADDRIRTGPVSELLFVDPLHSAGLSEKNSEAPAHTHMDLKLPFNLSLTDDQKKRRGAVPLPYAHEGEGVSLEFGDEDDDDDDD
jgi:elongator complex protein 5